MRGPLPVPISPGHARKAAPGVIRRTTGPVPRQPFMESTMKRFIAIALTTTCALAGPAVLAADHSGHGTAPAKAPAPAYSDGEVRRIDKTAGAVTLKHGPIANLGMPGMTMTFPVMQKDALDKLKVGDKVRFVAEDRSGNTVITRIEPAR